MNEQKGHKAGFVSIIGKPNVGKSTLMNKLVGERLSIITSKAQTTRHRIMGIINSDEYQIIYSDTPGIIEPKYALQSSMMRFVSTSLEDADLILFVVEANDPFKQTEIIERVKKIEAPVLVIINKSDKIEQEAINEKIVFWNEQLQPKNVIPVSALYAYNIEKVMEAILEYMPEHPPYFDKDQLTDKPERFFVSEIIREKILLNYKQEIPYASEVVTTAFKEEKNIIRIRVVIFVERDSQKGILIGKGGSMLKKIGTLAREDMEVFFNKKVFLEQNVKVDPDWRSNKQKLERYGYINKG